MNRIDSCARFKARILSTTRLLSGGIAATAVSAQAQDGQTPETVVVTSTRIVRDGFNAPTPTTVIGAEDIQKQAEANLQSVLNNIPVLIGNATTQTGNGGTAGGTNGISTVNLHNVGANRTLVLLDGQRVIRSEERRVG